MEKIYHTYLNQLSVNTESIINLTRNISQEQSIWKPRDSRWTLNEVVNHLVDIEKEDFGFEFKMIIESPHEGWPQFTGEQWRVERKYNERNFDESVKRFAEARSDNMLYLKSLTAPDLYREHLGPDYGVGKMRLGDVLASWVAHDFFHIRELSLIRWYILNQWDSGFSPEYSGFKIL